MKERTGRYIPTLDGWRCLAITVVIASHVATVENAPVWMTPARSYGGFGVEVFFALSGFLITSRLLEESGQPALLRRFYLRRLFRIFPCAWLYVGTVALLAALHLVDVRAKDLWASLFFFRNYVGAIVPGHFVDGDQAYTGHLWSLSVEEHFYLLWPWIFLVARRRPAVAALCAIAVASWRWVDAHFHIVNLPLVQPYFRTDLRLDFLLWGCFLALVHPRIMSSRLRRFAPLIGATAGVAAIFTAVSHPLPLSSLWKPAAIALMVYSTVLEPRSPLARVLELEPLRAIGRLSYSLYVWHVLFLVAIEAHRPLGMFQRLPLAVVGVVVMAAVSYRFVELPLMDVGRRLARRIGRPVVPAPIRADAA